MRQHRLLLLAVVTAAFVAVLALIADGCSNSGSQGSTNPSAAALAQLEQDTGVHWVSFSDYSYGAISFLKPTSPPQAILTGSATPAAVAGLAESLHQRPHEPVRAFDL